jgi:hypothetical protein
VCPGDPPNFSICFTKPKGGCYQWSIGANTIKTLIVWLYNTMMVCCVIAMNLKRNNYEIENFSFESTPKSICLD